MTRALIGCDHGTQLAASGLERSVPIDRRGRARCGQPIPAAVSKGATIGEIREAMRSVWGEHRETLTI